MNTSVIILAAGFSNRMAPDFKPLVNLPYPNGESMVIARLIDLYKSEQIEVYVVGGHRADDLIGIVQEMGAIFVRNQNPERGMFSSIQCGLNAVSNSATHIFIQPCDIPLIRELSIRSLIRQITHNPDTILHPVYKGKIGHPVLIPAGARNIVLSAKESSNLAVVLGDYPLRAIPLPDANILVDMDTRDDYEKVKNMAPKIGLLTSEEAYELIEVRGISNDIKMHLKAVGLVAKEFAASVNWSRRLHNNRKLLDLDVALAGGLVHDLFKGQPRHDEAVGTFFRTNGMEEMAVLVESHMDLTIADDSMFTEKEMVFLADKFVSGHSAVSIVDRFAKPMEQSSHGTGNYQKIVSRRAHAIAMANRFAEETRQDPLSLVQKVLAPLQKENEEGIVNGSDKTI